VCIEHKAIKEASQWAGMDGWMDGWMDGRIGRERDKQGGYTGTSRNNVSK